ncbi:MAG: hypothetical protein H0U86_14910 [Chloroflexi bacterium]|nr:hypothetical protein [Chloroflexota bacterium]
MRIFVIALAGLLIVSCQRGDVATSVSPPVVPATAQPASDPPLEIKVIAEDYRYDGLPATLTIGTQLSLRNEGAEPHELVLLRVSANTRIEAFVQLSQEDMLAQSEMVGVLVASPRRTADETITIEEVGLYVVVCFIPVGTESEHVHEHQPSASADIEQVQHYSVGMYASFSVG